MMLLACAFFSAVATTAGTTFGAKEGSEVMIQEQASAGEEEACLAQFPKANSSMRWWRDIEDVNAVLTQRERLDLAAGLTAPWVHGQHGSISDGRHLFKRWTGWKGNSFAHVVDLLAKYGMPSIAFVGDSLTSQLYKAALHSAQRHGCTVQGKKSQGDRIGDGVAIRCPAMGFKSVDVHCVMLPDAVDTEVVSAVGRVMGGVSVVVVNVGLHCSDERKYRQLLSGVIQQLCVSSKARLGIFAETTAQHFFNLDSTGSFHQSVQDAENCLSQVPGTSASSGGLAANVILKIVNDTCDPRLISRTCAPVRNASNWRNRVAKEVICDQCPRMSLIERYEATLPLWRMHPDPTPLSDAKKFRFGKGHPPHESIQLVGGQDCTHYTYSPWLYEPYWDGAVAAIERWAVKHKLLPEGAPYPPFQW
jgi:hypothetical protein